VAISTVIEVNNRVHLAQVIKRVRHVKGVMKVARHRLEEKQD
jgi:(p)ppGpp synthase/HD superfamily hydrolase